MRETPPPNANTDTAMTSVQKHSSLPKPYGCSIVAGFFARVVEGYDVPTLPLFTLIGSVAIAAIEVKSVFEKSSVKEKEDINSLISFLQHAANNDSLKSIINHLKSMQK